jgi:hypothetical protein
MSLYKNMNKAQMASRSKTISDKGESRFPKKKKKATA